MYGPEALALSTVKKWRRRFQEGRTDLMDDPRPGRSVTQDIVEAIQSMLTERTFMSCKVLCRHLRFGKARCLRILHNDFGLIKFHLHWIPHTDSRPEERKGNLFKPTSGHTRTTVANGLWICYNRRWDLVLFVQSPRRSVGSILRWSSQTDQTKKWYKKVSVFGITVR
jgi:hypothetical protein